MHHNPSPLAYVYLAAIAAGTAIACWVVRRESSQVKAAVTSPRPAQIGLDPESIAAARTLARRIVDSSTNDRRDPE